MGRALLLPAVGLALVLLAGVQAQTLTITAVAPSRYPALTATPFSLKVSLGWSADGAAGETDVYCRAHRMSRDDGLFSQLLGEATTSTSNDYDYLASSISIDGLIINSERWSTYRVQCSIDPAYPVNETSELVQEIWVVPGGLTLLPPLLAVVLTIATQNVLVSLYLGVLGGAFIRWGYNPYKAFLYSLNIVVTNAFADSGHIQVILFSWFLAGMIGILCRCGGGYGLAESISKYATTRRSTLLVVFLMGWIIFFDDYTSSLLVGMTMRPISDRMKISREKLAYLVDSSSAPIASLAPVSSWVGFEISMIKDGYKLIGDLGGDPDLYDKPYIAFLKTIPSRFYPLFVLFLQLFLICTNREFGSMLWAERRALRTGKLTADNANVAEIKVNTELEPRRGVPHRWWNAIIPIAVTIGVTLMAIMLTGYPTSLDGGDPITGYNIFGNGDSYKALLWSTFVGSIVAWLCTQLQHCHEGELYFPSWLRWIPFLKTHRDSQPLLFNREAYDVWIEGIKSLMGAILTLIMAWAIGDAMSLCGTGGWLQPRGRARPWGANSRRPP